MNGSAAVRGLAVGGLPGQRERHPLARGHSERGVVGQVAPGHRDRRVQPERVRPGDRDDPAVHPPHPRQDLAVAEPHPQIALHVHVPVHAFDDPGQHRGPAVAWGHEVDQPHRSRRGPPLGLQDERVTLIPARHPGLPRRPGPRTVRGGQRAAPIGLGARRCDTPVAVALGAQQAGETRGRVEPGQAQPVDRAIPADQRRRLHVADERVVLDQSRHRCPPAHGRRRGRPRAGPGLFLAQVRILPSAGQPYRAGGVRAPRLRCPSDQSLAGAPYAGSRVRPSPARSSP